MEPVEAIALGAAAFVGGAINAVAGGGSLVTFPALVAAGYSAKVANVTNTVALWPGYASGSFAYRDELGRQKARVRALAAPSVVGALAGSVILLATPGSAFDLAAPILVVFACLLLAVQDRLNAWARRGADADSQQTVGPMLLCATFVMGVYGAYFGAGLGIMTLAVLGVLLPDEAQHSNALKGMLSLIMNSVAFAWFALFGPVAWGIAAVMAVGALAGGYAGVGIARRLGKRWLRLAVIAYGLAAAAVLFARL